MADTKNIDIIEELSKSINSHYDSQKRLLDRYQQEFDKAQEKGATKEYCENVIAQKNKWLDEHFPSISKRYYLPYGTNKNYKNSRRHILVDDNKLIRSNYRGKALYPMWL